MAVKNELKINDVKQNYTIAFHKGGEQIGTLDFNGASMKFYGDAEESAEVFFDFIAKSFERRLEAERADEREKLIVEASK